MYRIDSANNVGVIPDPIPAVNAPGYFNNAPGAGPGTKVTGDFLNMIQEEIAGVIEAATIALDRTNRGQLLEAIRALVPGVTPPGVTVGYSGRNAPIGWVRGNGLTIGDALSGATERANADCQALFTLLWTDYADAELLIQTSAGGASARGASAAVDWTSHKRISLPNHSDRTDVGRGDMSGADAGLITVAGGNVDATVMGKKGGAQNKVLLAANLPSAGRYDWSHGVDTPSTSGGAVHGADRAGDVIGADAPFSTMNPFIVNTKIIKL